MKNLFEEAEILFNQGNLEDSKKICQKILKDNPKEINALILISVIAFKTNHFKKSLEILDYSIKLFPKVPEFYFNKAHVLTMQDDNQNALDNVNKSISLRIDYFEAYNLKGLILLKQKKIIDAIKSFKESIKIKPNFFEAYKNLFLFYKKNKQENDSIKILNEASKIFKNYYEIFWLKSTIYRDENKFDESLEEINKAIKFDPKNSESFNLRGIIYKKLGNFTESEKNFNESIKIDKNNYQAYHNLGNLLKIQKRFVESIDCFKKAVDINKFHKNGLGNYLFAKNSICDWEDYNSNYDNLISLIKSKNNVCSSFNLFSIIDSSELQLINAKLENNSFTLDNYNSEKISISNNKKIKIAYYSADFYNHPVSQSIVELIEVHDREKFEVIGVSFNSKKDQTKKRLVNAFDKFIDVENKSIDEIVYLSRNLNIDIAIDLMGYTENSRFAIFEKRCAPIQINFLGFAGTTASKNMDYIISDKCVINKNEINNYSEKIIYLPVSFMVSDTKKKPSNKLYDYKNYEFPIGAVVMCCFNSYYKISPKIFNIWCNILKKFEKTVLWLSKDTNEGIQNIEKEIEKKGINKNRLFFAKFENKIEDHLARLKLADICLDTYPYSSHSTAYDYLVSGIPIVTLKGNSFASNVSSSMLESLDLHYLITNSYTEYENKICELISSPTKILELKKNLEKNKINSTLFNIDKYRQNLEKSYQIVYKNKAQGLSLNNINID